MRSLFLVLFYLGGFVSLMGFYGTMPFVGTPPTPGVTATPQVLMNRFAVVFGDRGGNPIDMGATPDTFVANGDWNQEPAASATGTGNLCGATPAPNCGSFKYIDHIKNSCLTPQTVQVMTDAGVPATTAPGETWFQHFYPGNPTPSPTGTPWRLVGQNVGATCGPYYVAPLPINTTPPIYNHPFVMNLADAGFRTELTTCCWTNTGANFYPQTQTATTPVYWVYEDTSGVLGLGITGGAGGAQPFSTEYGCGFNGGNTCRIDQVGTGPYHVAVDYDTALGAWANSACGSPCLKMTINGASPEGGTNITCDVFNTPGPITDCHDRTFTGYINNTFEKALAKADAANSAGNIVDWDMESPIYDHLNGGWGSPALLSAVLNTWNQFQQDSANNGRTITDLEPGWGTLATPGPGVTPGAPGDTTTNVRTMSIAMEWLIPDCGSAVSSNDRIIPRRLPIGLTTSEAPSFFELFLVPFAPVECPGPYSYPGSITTVGSGCPTGQGESGGITVILKACASDNGGVYAEDYNQFWFNGHNYGPITVLVNTSSSDTFAIQSGWFSSQPLLLYNFVLALAPSEMQSVAQGNIGGGVANFPTCTNGLYCSAGGNTLATNSSASLPANIAPHTAYVYLTTNT